MRRIERTWVLVAAVSGATLALGCSDGQFGGTTTGERSPDKTGSHVVDRGFERKVGSGPVARVIELRLGVRSKPAVASKRARSESPLETAKRYAIRALDNATHSATNPRQRMRVRFERDAVTVRPDGASARDRPAARGWTLRLRLSRWGRAKDLERVPAVRARQTRRNRIEYRRGRALTEWYLNRPAGLEQGFDLADRPFARQRGELVLELSLGAGLRPQLVPRRGSAGAASYVALRDASGRVVARYHGLHVYDARRRAQPARLALVGDRVQIRVDDSAARYPLTIDPLVSVEASISGFAASDGFGQAVDQRGDLSFVGAPGRAGGGAVKVAWPWGLACSGPGNCVYAPSSGTLAPPDTASQFGRAVAFDGQALQGAATLVVGAVNAVYIFVRASLPAALALQRKIVGPAGPFGTSVDVSGDTVVVGRDGDAPLYLNGSATVYVRASGAWSSQQVLSVGGQTVRVALEGDTLAVGTLPSFRSVSCYPGVVGGCGRVYVYVRSGRTWAGRVIASGLHAQHPSYTGRSVALAGDLLVVGDYGRAHVYRRSGTTWALETTLTPSIASPTFGSSVAVSGNTVIVGDPFDDAQAVDAGAAYVFIYGAKGWELRGKLFGKFGAAGRRFGSAVAAGGEKIVLAGSPTPGGTGGASHLHLTLADAGQSCGVDDDCYAHVCSDGTCCSQTCNTLCSTCQSGSCVVFGLGAEDRVGAQTCSGTQACDGRGACRRKNGQGCSLGSDCASGHCVDGVCCNAACQGTCRACNVSGSVGTCAVVNGSRDPLTCDGACNTCSAGVCTNVARYRQTTGTPSCTGVLACDGQGGCKKRNGQGCASGADCVSGHCFDGVCCNVSCQATCRACNLAGKVGTCSVVSGARDPGTCDGVCHTCQSGACSAVAKGGEVTSVPSCSGTRACDGFGLCKKKNGQTCSSGADCSSGHCADGVCCDTACQGACRRCNDPSALGRCTPVDGARDPGTCDGVCGVCQAGVCKAVAKGGQVSGVPSCTGTSACDGFGLCKKRDAATCSSGADCVSGHCVDGVCCDSACQGACRACNNTGSVGTCSPVSGKRDPGTCDGVCGSCVSGSCQAVAKLTDVTAGTVTCTGDNTCDGQGVCRKKNGKRCSSGPDCASGNCADDGSGRGTRVCCDKVCDGPCQVCGANGACANAPKGTDPKGACVGTHPKCGGSCDDRGQCAFPPSGSDCGECKVCDGKGDCNGTPKDDDACGVIDCSKLDNDCYEYADLTSDRCASFGSCKDPNITQTCRIATPKNAPGCEDGGAPLPPDVGVDSNTADAGADGNAADVGKAADAGADGKSPGAEGKGAEEDGGCSCSSGRGRAPGSAALLLTLLLGGLLVRRRRRR